MAKTRVNNEEDEAKISIDASTEETIIERATGKKDLEATISTGKKYVKIRTTEDIDCIISCKPYKIAKDKEASVPMDVAAILCYAKKAYRL